MKELYEILRLEPPFEIEPFEEMKKREAKKYFSWFMTQIDVCIDELNQMIRDENFVLDFTPNSLGPLWKWFLDNMIIVPRNKEEYEEDVRRRGGCSKYVRRDYFSEKTLQKGRIIGIYFAETLRKNNENLYWDIAKGGKKMFSVNEPVIYGICTEGFCPFFDPRFQISNCMLKAWDDLEKKETSYYYKENQLLFLYKLWENAARGIDIIRNEEN